jgi:nicotinamidase-related amidase
MEDEKTPTFKKFLNPNFDVHSEGDYWEKFKPLKDKTALLIIDVQKHDQDLAVELRNAGNSYLYDRLKDTVIPNARRLLTFFRDQQMVVTCATCRTGAIQSSWWRMPRLPSTPIFRSGRPGF